MKNSESTIDFRSLFESLPALFLILSPDFTILAVSDAYLSATMTVRQKITGKNLFEVFPDNPDDPQVTGEKNLRASLKTVLEKKTSDTMAVQKYDIRRPESQGGKFEERYWSPVNSPVFKPGTKEILYIVHRVEDVTDYVRPRKSKSSENDKQLKLRLQQMEADIFVRGQELQKTNKELAEAEAYLRKAHDKLEKRVIKSTDELQRAQKLLIRQEKLQALGEMASGIAHDINNALSPILGYSELMLDGKDCSDATHKEYIKTINVAAKDAGNVIARLRQFGRPREANENFGPVNLKQITEETIALTKPKWRNQAMTRNVEITIAAEVSEDLFVLGQENSLREALMNLIFNAVDAMVQDGVIHIRGYQEKDKMVLVIKDSGAGMDELTRQKCFEPFFSTKGEGGTGLGLAMVYGIVQRHGGTIDVQSETGKGTAFLLSFPAAKGVCKITAPSSKGGMLRPLSVLYVEDDEKIREVISSYLTRDGHTVETAAHGAEGLQKFLLNKDRYDLVITDQSMPFMPGDHMALAIHKIAPDQKIVMLAGTPDEKKSSLRLENINRLLDKPVTMETLRKTLQELFS